MNPRKMQVRREMPRSFSRAARPASAVPQYARTTRSPASRGMPKTMGHVRMPSAFFLPLFPRTGTVDQIRLAPSSTS